MWTFSFSAVTETGGRDMVGQSRQSIVVSFDIVDVIHVRLARAGTRLPEYHDGVRRLNRPPLGVPRDR
jgi:hypothetical protein